MRKLILDICDYNKTAVCNLYDNQSHIVGQATDVFIKTECRTGWKELSFSLPSFIEGEEGKEKNFRLDYLKADWWIRTIDDYTVDWYIISQPKITHNAFSQNVEVVAGHISQILKTKNLGLEFSDEEGNNVGTAKELLDCILENTGWTAGNVAQFMEDDDFTKEKKRSLDSPTRSGAFKHITTMCELFDAYPVFHGDEKTVDILPINPFSREIEFDGENIKVGRAIDLEEGQIPVVALHTEVLELHYDKNVRNISRTLNTENLVTKLTTEGNIGDTTVEPCSLSNAYHYEYTFTTEGITKGTEVQFTDKFDTKYYFTAIEDIQAGELNYSTLDFLSQSYIWDGTIAHPVYKYPKGSYNTLSPVEAEAKKNWFTYLMSFDYYMDIGLFTQDMLNSAAEFQRFTPALLEASFNASTAMSEQQNILSNIGESMTGFLKLSIAGRIRIEGNLLKLYINKDEGDEGVLYRSDYAETRKKRFAWHVAHKLKANGDSVDNTGSVVYIIKDLGEDLPPRWIRGYVRSVDDETEEYKDIDGNVETRYKDYTYTVDNEDPSFITTFIDYDEFLETFQDIPEDFFSDPDVYVFLFCTNSMMGYLGTQLVADEAAVQALETSTKVVTETHPTYFVEEDYQKLPRNPSELTQTYAFGCVRHKDADCELYFYCVNIYDLDTWSELIISAKNAELPTPSAEYMYKYYFDPWYSKLYFIRETEGQYEWVYMDSVEEKRITQNVSKTLYFCRRRDMLYKGLYEKYIYTIPSGETLPQGNYCVETPYYFGWFFTTDKEMNIEEPAQEQYILGGPNANVEFTEEEDKFVSDHISITAYKWYEYYFENKTRVIGYDSNDGLVSDNEYIGGQKVSVYPAATYLVVEMPEAPVEGEYIQAKTTLDIWVDTANNVVYQESSAKDVVEAQSKKYDTVSYPIENMLVDTKFAKGSIDSNGVEINSNSSQRTYNIDIIVNVSYEYKLPSICSIYLYDIYRHVSRVITASQGDEYLTGTFTIKTNEKYMKILYPATSEFDTDSYYFRVEDYQNKVFAEDKAYTILRNIHTEGQLKGIDNLMRKFALQSDVVYGEYLSALLAAQNAVKEAETELSNVLKDLYREGWTKDETYVKGDENKLYRDTLSDLREISRPETTYDVDFLDTYSSNEDDEYYMDESTSKFAYLDIQSNYAAHLIDPEINTNIWCYIDVLNKCYDKPWETTLEINTNLSDVSQHSFTDVMSYIADVAKRTKANQSIYARAENINQDGSITTEQIQGQINTTVNEISGGSSNWYTDEKGNIVIESQDGLSAIMITGTGILYSNGKNADGDWNWNTATTGEGILADAVTSGTFTGALIKTGTITADALASNVGQALDIASNEALYLYATTDGIRPAGGLDTHLPGTGDSYIIIEAGKQETGRVAHIDIASGGKINLYGASSVNIGSNGAVNITGGSVNITSDSTATITGSTVDIKGGSTVNITADPNTSAGKINILSGGTLDLQSGGVMNITAGGTLNISSVSEQTPAEINIISGGKMNVLSSGEMNIESGGKLTLHGDSDVKITSGSAFKIRSGSSFIVDSPLLKIYEVPNNKPQNWDELTVDEQEAYLATLEPSQKTAKLSVSGEITATSGVIGGFTIEGNNIHCGATTMSGSSAGIYIGTDGVRFATSSKNSLVFSPTDGLTIDTSNINITANQVSVGGVTLTTTLESMKNATPTITVSSSAPSGPKSGDLWYDTSNHIQYIYSGGQWVDTSQEIPEVTSINGAMMSLDANAGEVHIYSTSGGTNNAISMTHEGIDIASNAGINISAGGSFYLSDASQNFLISINQPGSSSNIIKLAGFKADGSTFTSENGKVYMVSSNAGAAIALCQSAGTPNVLLDPTGISVGSGGTYGFTASTSGGVSTTELGVYGPANITGDLIAATLGVNGHTELYSSVTVRGELGIHSDSPTFTYRNGLAIRRNDAPSDNGTINASTSDLTVASLSTSGNVIAGGIFIGSATWPDNCVFGYNTLLSYLDARYVLK